MAGVRVLPPELFDLDWHKKADPELLDDLAAQEDFFATWKWFAGYPAMDAAPLPGGGRKIVFKDLRFGIKSPPALKIVDGDRAPFSLTAWIGAGGKLEKYSYDRPSGRDAQRVPN
jgi:hypothetical protein